MAHNTPVQDLHNAEQDALITRGFHIYKMEELFVKLVEGTDDMTLGSVFRMWLEGTIVDTQWEGWSLSERETLLRAFVDMARVWEASK